MEFEIKKGKKYVCIKDGAWIGGHSDFIEGRIYKAPEDGYVIDENGCRTWLSDIWYRYDHFRPASKVEVILDSKIVKIINKLIQLSKRFL